MRPRFRRRVAWLIAGLVLSLTAAVPLAAVALPYVYRHRQLRRLAGEDDALRERALNYVYRRAAQDEAVLRGAAEQLRRNDWPRFVELFRVLTRAGVAERPVIAKAAVARLEPLNVELSADPNQPAWLESKDRFIQMVNLLDDAGLWERGIVPLESWENWLCILAFFGDHAARMLAAQLIGQSPRVSDSAIPTVTALAHDPDSDVRLHALLAAGELRGWVGRQPGHESQGDRLWLDMLIAELAEDSNPELAHLAGVLREAIADQSACAPLAGNDAIEAQLLPRIVRAAAADDAEARALRRFFFASDQASLRDVGCVIAADALDPERAAAFAGELLTSFSDTEKMSGAVLCGLTQSNAGLLAERAAKEDVWAVQQVMRLGLWMQHQGSLAGDDMAEQAAMLLTRGEDVPVTTVLLAMLASSRGGGEGGAGGEAARRWALEYLFNPWGQPPTDLVELLATERWWLVLRRYLPADAPRFDMAAPPGRRPHPGRASADVVAPAPHAVITLDALDLPLSSLRSSPSAFGRTHWHTADSPS